MVTIARFEYLLLMAACVAVTLPLEFAFAARVYRRPRRLLRALALPLALFVVWDAVPSLVVPGGSTPAG
jgi:hypothetical protein